MTYEEWKKCVQLPQSYPMYNADTVRKLVERIEELKAENGDLKAHVEYLMTECHIFTHNRLNELLEQRVIESRIRIDDLERWIKGIADDKQMPTYAQQSARSLLAQEYSKVLYRIKPSDRGDYFVESVVPTTFGGDAVNYVFRGRLEDCEIVRDELMKGLKHEQG